MKNLKKQQIKFPGHDLITYTSGGQTTARGPTPARHHLISGPRKKYNILHLRKKKN